MRYAEKHKDQSVSKTPRTKPPEVRLDELMSSAEKLFLEKGVESTTVNEIVELADVAKGTFYHYFASKNELLEAMGKRYTAAFMQRIQETVDKCEPDDWLGRLRSWITASVLEYVNSYRTHDIVYTNHHHHNRNNSEKNAILEQLETILCHGVDAGAWHLEQPRITALLIYAGVHGATDEIIATAHQEEPELFAKNITSVCLRLIDITQVPNKPKH